MVLNTGFFKGHSRGFLTWIIVLPVKNRIWNFVFNSLSFVHMYFKSTKSQELPWGFDLLRLAMSCFHLNKYLLRICFSEPFPFVSSSLDPFLLSPCPFFLLFFLPVPFWYSKDIMEVGEHESSNTSCSEEAHGYQWWYSKVHGTMRTYWGQCTQDQECYWRQRESSGVIWNMPHYFKEGWLWRKTLSGNPSSQKIAVMRSENTGATEYAWVSPKTQECVDRSINHNA